MKKSYLGFILLLGCLVFSPQIALGDSIMYKLFSPMEIHKKHMANINGALCLFEKKSNLPQKYTNGNLKIQKIPKNHSDYRIKSNYKPISTPSFEYTTDINITGQDVCGVIFNCEKVSLPIEVVRANYIKENYGKKSKGYNVKSYIFDCKEYIIGFIGEKDNGLGGLYTEPYGYDVTDVPVGSYLKYIPETHEVQVFSLDDKSYQQIIDENIYTVKQKLKEIKQKEIKWILLFIGIPSVIALIMIIVAFGGKEIFKKFRKQ